MKSGYCERLRTRWVIITLMGLALFGAESSAQDRGPRTGWGDAEAVEAVSQRIAPDLQALHDRSAKASSVIDYNSIVEGCRTVAGDTTRPTSERAYAKKLLSWAANRRGELRTDMAGQMVRDHLLDEAEKLDRTAAEDFALAIELDPSRWRAHHNLGIAMAMSDNLDLALASFSKTIELNPKFSDAYFNRGELYVRKGDFRTALADYDKAIEISPEDAGMVRARADAKSQNGDPEGALADYEAVMRLEPESGEAASTYADMCQSLGKWKEAATAYQKAIQLTPDDPLTLQNVAWMMATCPDEYYRNPESALKTAQRAIETSRGESNAHRVHVLGVAQAASGDFSSAVATLNEAMQLTSDPILRSELAQHRALFQRKKPYIQPTVVER